MKIGQRYLTKPGKTGIRCCGYDAPPPNGNRVVEYEPGTMLGPVEEYTYSNQFATIRVGDVWINVWRAKYDGGNWGTNYAFCVATGTALHRWPSSSNSG